jgi:WD40 repeat protein
MASLITVLSDGRIISGSDDRTLKIWNTQTGKCDITFRGHDDSITCVAVHVSQKQLVDPSMNWALLDRRIVSGSDDRTLKIWNLQTGKCDITFRGHSDCVSCVAELPDGRIVSGSCNGILKIWNVQTGKCDITFEEHDHWIICIAVLPDGRIVCGSNGGILKIWNVQTGEYDNTFEGHNASVCVAVLPDGRIVSGSLDKTIKIWNPQTGKCDITFTGHILLPLFFNMYLNQSSSPIVFIAQQLRILR